MRAARFALAVAMMAGPGCGAAAAGNYAQESLDHYFRFEYQVSPDGTRPVVNGYVYNMSPGVPVERMQVAVQSLDAAGNVVGTTSTWVLGGVPAGNRAYFTTHVVPASSYRAQVLFFDWGNRGTSN
jgi:hypothetical protein